MLAIGLAGCGGGADGPGNRAERAQAADNRATAAGFVPPAPMNVSAPSVDPVPVAEPGGALPPATMQYRYIGRWAASTALCTDGAWRFETRKLTTAGETSCDFPEVTNIPTGFELRGTCRAEGNERQATVRLTFDEARRRMRVAGGGLGPTDLLYCGA